jgi:hypothetical protein
MATTSVGDNAGEDLKKAAYGAYLILKDNLPENCTLSVQHEDDLIISALKRHGMHLSTHAVEQNHLDPFKLLCWIGCAIIQGVEKGESYYQQETIVTALIESLEVILASETNCGVIIPQEDKILLHRLVMAEIRGNGDHGIGFNGLFAAFHCYRSAHKLLKSKLAPH